MMSNRGSFKTSKGSILLLRVGSANGIVQKHKSKPLNIDGSKIEDPDDIEIWKKSVRRPPERRGFFAFPYPFDDAFYYYHQYEKLLPKIYQRKSLEQNWNKTDEDFATVEEWYNFVEARDAFFEERNKELKKVISRHKQKKIWYKGHFYSHICPKNQVDDGRVWWRYENVNDWVKAARSKLWCYTNWGSGCFKINYDIGHLELFIPE